MQGDAVPQIVTALLSSVAWFVAFLQLRSVRHETRRWKPWLDAASIAFGTAWAISVIADRKSLASLFEFNSLVALALSSYVGRRKKAKVQVERDSVSTHISGWQTAATAPSGLSIVARSTENMNQYAA